MSIELTMPELTELQPRITVMGVGGAGGNAVNNMIRSELQGVSFVVANTDAQALANSLCDTRIQLGVESTRGLGAGSKPEVGERAAQETLSQIEQHLDGCHMLFLAAGMGGGTGTGAAPVIAKAARERGILTVGVVTKPFSFEGNRRMKIAADGLAELQEQVDTLIVIPNQNLFRIATEKTTFQDAFAMADDVLNSGVRGITDLMVMPGLINLDFADVRTVMMEMGKAMMGTGEADGENRAVEAATAAISNPLLDEVSLKGAKGVIINITGGMDLTLFEVDEAAKHIRSQVDEDANIIVGSAFNETLNGQIRVSVVATGIDSEAMQADEADHSSASVVSFSRTPRSSTSGTANTSAPASVMQPRAEAVVARALESEQVRVLEDDPDMVFTSHDSVADNDVDDPDYQDKMDEAGEEARADEEYALAAAHSEDAFVAPEPKMPQNLTAPAGRPDVFAEAAYENGVKEEKETVSEVASAHDLDGQRERGMSLFRRMTSFGNRVNDTDERHADVPTNPAQGSGAATKVDEDGATRLGRLTPEDRPVPSGRSEEQLEIPAFLRRQIN